MAGAQWHQATESVQAAMQLDPNEPAALRAAARLYSRKETPQAFGLWKKLLAHPGAGAGDRREATRFGLAVHRYDLCEEQLGLLLKSAPDDPENLDLAAQLALQRNDHASAKRFNDRLLSLHTTHPAARLRQGQLLLASTEPDEKRRGTDELLSLGRSDAPTALNALETLAQARDLAPELVRNVAGRLATHPTSTTEHRLAAVSLEIRLTPENKAALVNEAIAQFHSGKPDDLARLARWTMQQGQPARVLEFLPSEVALTRQDLFLVRLDALALQREWKEIRRVLTEAKSPVEEFHRAVFLARAAHELGEQSTADTHWAEALDKAAGSPAFLGFLAQYAARIHVLPVAEKAWRKLARHPNWTLRAHLALVPILEAQGDTRGLRDVLRKLSKLAPNDPAPRHDAAYLDLLLKENVSTALKTAEELLTKHPDRLPYRTTLALAHLRAGNPEAARRQYEGFESQVAAASPGALAVRVAVLFASQEVASAKEVAARIEQGALKPEERELLVPLQRTIPSLRGAAELR